MDLNFFYTCIHIQVLLSPGSRRRSQNNILGGVSSTHCPRSPVEKGIRFKGIWGKLRYSALLLLQVIPHNFPPLTNLCLEWAPCCSQPGRPVCCPGPAGPLCFRWHETGSGSGHWPRPASHWDTGRKQWLHYYFLQSDWINDWFAHSAGFKGPIYIAEMSWHEGCSLICFIATTLKISGLFDLFSYF